MAQTPEQLSVAAGGFFGIQLGRKLDAIIYLLQAYASNTQTATQLSTASVGFKGVPDGRKFDIALYLLAQKAANGNSPTVLSVASTGFKAIPEGRKADVVIYLLQQLVSNTQTPTQISTSSATLKGITDGRKPDVILYLLQKVAGNSQTPEQLSNASILFNGVPEGRKPDIAIYLLNTISTAPVIPFPLSDPTLLGWWKADSLALVDGNSVASWNDSSHSGFTMTQGVGGRQPIYHTNIKNGLPAVLFASASGQFLTSLMPSNTKPFTVAGVIMSNVFSTQANSLCGSTTNGDLNVFVSNGASVRVDTQGGAGIANPAFTFNNGSWYILTVTYDGSGNWAVYVNAGSSSGLNNQSFTGGGVTTMGAKGDTGNGLTGYIGEMLKFSSVVSSATIDTYLNGRWAVH